MTPEPELNKVEVWIAEHSIRILAVLGLLIVVGGFFVARAVIETGETSRKVTRIEPQVTRVNKAICDRQSLDHPQRAERCAERMRVGLINCRRSEPCRAAFLAIATYPPPAKPAPGLSTTAPSSKGVVPQQPSNHGHQQPGPHEGGHAGAAPTGAGGNSDESPGSEDPAREVTEDAQHVVKAAEETVCDLPGTSVFC